MLKARFKTLGCKLNQAETAQISELFGINGIAEEALDTSEQTQLVFVNTCAVTNKAAAKSRHTIARMVREFPDAVIVAAGCLAQLDPESLNKINGVDYIIGTADRFSVDYWQGKPVQTIIQIGNALNRRPFVDSPGRSRRSRPLLKIQDGCDHGCTYCIIPRLRGDMQSVPSDDVINALMTLLDNEAYEVVLTGVRIGSWGVDLGDGEGLSGLLRNLTAIGRPFRLRLGSVEPWELNEELIELVTKNEKICPHLHIPIQHSEKRILEMMGRPPVDDTLEMIRTARSANVNLAVGIDLIAGFPGETDRDFSNLVAKLEDLPTTYLHAFTFSPRPGTQAANLKSNTDSHVVRQRVKRLRDIGERKRTNFMASQLNKVLEVIPERSLDEAIWVKAVSDNYIKLYLKSEDVKEGKPIAVRLCYDTEIGYFGILNNRAKNAS